MAPPRNWKVVSGSISLAALLAGGAAMAAADGDDTKLPRLSDVVTTTTVQRVQASLRDSSPTTVQVSPGTVPTTQYQPVYRYDTSDTPEYRTSTTYQAPATTQYRYDTPTPSTAITSDTPEYRTSTTYQAPATTQYRYDTPTPSTPYSWDT